MNRGTLLVRLIIPCLITVTRADISKEELQKWVDDSTLIFNGTIVAPDGNVDSITASDYPITVKAARVELAAANAEVIEAREAVRIEQRR